MGPPSYTADDTSTAVGNDFGVRREAKSARGTSRPTAAACSFPDSPSYKDFGCSEERRIEVDVICASHLEAGDGADVSSSSPLSRGRGELVEDRVRTAFEVAVAEVIEAGGNPLF